MDDIFNLLVHPGGRHAKVHAELTGPGHCSGEDWSRLFGLPARGINYQIRLCFKLS